MQVENVNKSGGTLADKKAVADSALEEYIEATENQNAFIKKHSLGKWGLVISFLAAVGVVLACVFSDIRESGLIIPICIVGFIIAFLVVEFLLCLIVDSALRARHKQEWEKIRDELNKTKKKYYEEERKYLEEWCGANFSDIYRVVIDEEVKTPTTSQIHVLTRYAGCHSRSAQLILRKQGESDRMEMSREWAITVLIELLASGVKASLEPCDNF